ncbi:DUF4097 and DUF4098 domain-containing protein YvlB [Rhodococcus wratislaviensis]|uniref:DUF4097 domain-containing protein n=1 Tax=Rhodococcus wratislaviensis TaxID=44752 RepID=A0AB38FNS6_RHOWR|nr:DUF4097 family beta strand repeat-containing protein [Rhodococcus wratislaviensis]REE71449.1 DUF4097 and DUF4098 domain-containing protein YvlB [Rhodococcus wratislaviensis]SPZ43216.1 Uncharacterised protein [Rhodococcus wratislaviensis]
MPNFDTPEPISVTLELGVGNVRVTASDRTDTTVDVRPSDESDESDVYAAQRVRVDYANGVLQVSGPKARVFDFSHKTRSVEVSINLPSGSQVSGEVQVGDLSGTGRLGECRFKTSAGNVRLERSGPLRVDTAAGHVTADGVAGNAEIHTGSGRVRIGATEGSVAVKNSNGDTMIDAATGNVRVRSTNGDISVDRAGAGVEAKTSNGSIRLGEVARGSVELGTAMGDLEIGIAEGAAARLQVNSKFGQVHNLLDDTARPEASDETVEVRAHTSFGGITIRRS